LADSEPGKTTARELRLCRNTIFGQWGKSVEKDSSPLRDGRGRGIFGSADLTHHQFLDSGTVVKPYPGKNFDLLMLILAGSVNNADLKSLSENFRNRLWEPVKTGVQNTERQFSDRF
jgi:hypothetical protein